MTANGHDQLKFLYQPVVQRDNRTISCVHALVVSRQDAPQSDDEPIFGARAPDQPCAPSAFVLNQLLADLPRLKRMYGDSCGVSFTFSEDALGDRSFIDIVQQALSAHHVNPTELHVGVAHTDGDFSPSVMATLDDLGAIGVPISCAQFGTGGATLRSLSAVKFDFLTLDRRLVQRMMADKPTRSLIAAIAAFCHDANITLVADGVDDAMILNELEPFNCPGVQGALFGDPVEIEALLLPVQQPFALQEDPAPKPMVSSPEQVEVLRAQIEELDPRRFDIKFPDFLARAEEIKVDLQRLPRPADQELACMLGQRVTIAAVYADEKLTSLDWGLETSNLAEELGQLAVSAQMLALISTVPTTTESSRFVRVEALSRALQIRSTTELEPGESGTLDNILAMALAHMGLFDRAIAWWSNLIRQHEDLDLPGHTYAGVNLAEVELARLEDSGFTGSAVVRETSLRRMERAVARVARSQFTSPGIAEALQARQALLHGDATGARELLGSWLTLKPAEGVPAFLVIKARAMLARENDQPLVYLKHATQLIDEVSDTVILRIHRPQMFMMQIEALTLAGRLEEALQAQRVLIDLEMAMGQRRASSMFDWLQIRIDVDLQFAHYADLARLPQASKLDS